MPFIKYVLSFRPRLPHPDKEDKYWITSAGIVSLILVSVLLSEISLWFFLLLTGIIPLGLYLSYLNKESERELK